MVYLVCTPHIFLVLFHKQNSQFPFFLRLCILYYIKFNTLFACHYLCVSCKPCFCHKTTYTWPPPKIDGKACFVGLIQVSVQGFASETVMFCPMYIYIL